MFSHLPGPTSILKSCEVKRKVWNKASRQPIWTYNLSSPFPNIQGYIVLIFFVPELLMLWSPLLMHWLLLDPQNHLNPAWRLGFIYSRFHVFCTWKKKKSAIYSYFSFYPLCLFQTHYYFVSEIILENSHILKAFFFWNSKNVYCVTMCILNFDLKGAPIWYCNLLYVILYRCRYRVLCYTFIH